MKRSRKLDVGIWTHDERIPIEESHPQRRFWPPRMIGLIGTLVFHLLVVHSVLLGTRAQKVPPPEVQGPGASLIKSESDPAETLILIELPTIALAPEPLFDDFASAGPASKNLQVAMINPDPIPHAAIPQEGLSDNDDAVASVDSGDPAARERLFGIYSGQIEARIKRAWRRPRSPVNPDSDPPHDSSVRTITGGAKREETFQCGVRIVQDARGFVQEVQMLNCNGSVAWQQSLVAAILSASPLPAPPSPMVFARALTMTLSGFEYTSGNVTDDYEIELPRMQAHNGDSNP